MAMAAMVSLALILQFAGGDGDFARAPPLASGDCLRLQEQRRGSTEINRREARSGIGQPGKHHQIDVATNGLAPLAELRRKSTVFAFERAGFEIQQPLVDKIEGVVDELSRLVGSHGGCQGTMVGL